MGTSSALASCCSVLTLGEDLPFSIKLRVLTFNPLSSASERMESPVQLAAYASFDQRQSHLVRNHWRLIHDDVTRHDQNGFFEL